MESDDDYKCFFQVARDVFMQGMHSANHQKHRLREDVHVEVDELITINVEGGKISEEGIRKNTSVALKYISEWLQVCSKHWIVLGIFFLVYQP